MSKIQTKEQKQARLEHLKTYRAKNLELVPNLIDCYKDLFGIKIGQPRKAEIDNQLQDIKGLIEKLKNKEPEKYNYVQGLFAKYQNPEEKKLIERKIESFANKAGTAVGNTFIASATKLMKKKPFLHYLPY